MIMNGFRKFRETRGSIPPYATEFIFHVSEFVRADTVHRLYGRRSTHTARLAVAFFCLFRFRGGPSTIGQRCMLREVVRAAHPHDESGPKKT